MHICFVVKNIHDKTGQTALALCNEFIKAGHHVHFALFDLDEESISLLPQCCSYTFIDGKCSLLNIIPASKLRKWLHYIKYWNATEIIFTFDKQQKDILKLCAALERVTKPIIQFEQGQSTIPDISQKYLNFLSTIPKDIIHFPDNSKVLIIESGGVGDIAQRFADIKLFKHVNPTIKIWLCVHQKHAAFAKMQPCVDGVIQGFKKPLPVLYNTIKQIRAQHFDWITDISHNGGHSFALIFFSGIKNKFKRERLQYRDEIAVSVSDNEKIQAQKLLCNLSGKKIFLSAGAGAKIKMYPAKHWIILLNELAKEGWRFVFCGNGKTEKELIKQITDALPNGCYIDLINKTSLSEIAGIASQCKIAIGNDTGLLHIAALSGIPTLGIFSQPTAWQTGFTMPWFTEITADREIGRFNWHNPNDYRLDKIKPETVKQKFDELVRNWL